MSTKRYRLLKDHPFAIAGKILKVIDQENGNFTLREESRTTIHMDIQVPQNAIGIWLEEVKEEPMCSKEFAEAISAYIKEHGNDGWVWTGESKSFKCWLERHTSKE